jgi:hypothetical protein
MTTDGTEHDAKALEELGDPLQTGIEEYDPELVSADQFAGHYAGRYGTFMLATTCNTPPAASIAEKLERALEDDTRIKEIGDVHIMPEWYSRKTAYPRSDGELGEALLSDEDHFHAIRFSDPFSFIVSVPKRNQPPFRGYTDFPSDTYYVAWDGVTAVVLWERTPDAVGPPRAGGQVVVDVLTDVVAAAGFELYVQPCSPNCTNLFAHTVLQVEQSDVGDEMTLESDPDSSIVVLHVPFNGEPLGLVAKVCTYIRVEAEYFARFKNGAQRIMDLESFARSMVAELLELQYERNATLKLGRARRFLSKIHNRGSKRKIQGLIASLWLVFARLEERRSEWFSARDRFVDSIERYGTGALFKRDHRDELRTIERQDLAFIRAAIEQSANRLDSSTIALVTGLSAVAAVIGAVIGALIAVAAS